MAPIKFIIVIVTFLLVSIASSITDNLPPANPFSPYLDGKVPEIVKEIQPWTLDEKMNVMVRKVVIHARFIPDSKEGDSNVFVILAKPEKEGKYPGLLFLHGGGGFADETLTLAKVWAKAGYVVASPDLPGNADPKKVPYSTGPIRLTYDKSRWTANPDVTASSTFDGPIAAVKTFYLLKSQPEVIANKIGVTGVSWGGYMTTILCGLLGNEVKAAVTVWGAGFYDYGSTFQTALGKMPENERELWLKHLDAGRYAVNIQCAMLFVSATNDKWFYPPCVMKTYDTVKSSKMILWAPNKSHYADNVSGGSKSPKRRSMVGVESDFLDYHLKDEGKPFPKVSIDSVKKRTLDWP
jgi:dienelactone hydrolase